MNPKPRTVSIVIPCYNESATLPQLLAKIRVADTLGLTRELIVVNDGSTDGFLRLVPGLKRQKVKLLTHPVNLGKTAAVKSGIRVSSGDVIIIQDADLEYSPGDYPALLEPLVAGLADVVYGSRFIGSRPHRVMYFWHYAVNRWLTALSNLLSNLNLTDMETGYKAFSGRLLRRVAPALSSTRFGFEPEITARLAGVPGIRFYEVGVSYYGRTYAEGKHIRWHDALRAVGQIIRYNLFG